MSLDAYFAMEEQASGKHEYVAGEIYAMSGATRRHVLITLNIVAALRVAALARRCEVFASEMKLRAAKDRVYYPDVMVACGGAADVELIVEEPSLVAEVTSRSTRATDRREKLDAYLKIASLDLYLIVAQRHRHVIAYTRGPGSEWLREEFHREGDIPIPFLGAQITLDQIYDHVPLPPLSVKEGDDDWEQWEDRAEVEELAV